MARRKKSNVVGLRGAVPVHGVPDEAVVNILQELLNKAKAGGIMGIAFATVEAADSGCRGWYGERANSQAMITTVTELFFSIMATDLGFIKQIPVFDSDA